MKQKAGQCPSWRRTPQEGMTGLRFAPRRGDAHRPARWPSLAALLLLMLGPACDCSGRSLTAAPAAIASAHPLATQAGVEVLAKGGNAFDAAVAVAAALAVVEPFGSGLGGGGFWLLHRAQDGRDIMVDARERAPLAAHRDLYLDARGHPVPGASIDGPLAAAIPGLPAALVHVAGRYAHLPLAATLQPAIRYAREGFRVGDAYRRAAAARVAALRKSPEAARLFLARGQVPQPGFLLVQPDLARTLETLARHLDAGFYRGPVAEALVRGVRRAGGCWSLADLEGYRVVERAPLHGEYRGVKITTTAPPGGGPVLLETLNILGEHDLAGYPSPTAAHVVVEAMRRAYRDRDRYLGDPDFVAIPLSRLLSRDYAAGLNAAIRIDRALPSAYLAGAAAERDGANTSHFSIIDREGNAAAVTLSINYAFGAAFVPPGTGVLLNDEMDDFATLPGAPNVYGLVGGEANRIAPGKRMLSSMAPTFLEDHGRFAALGTPGGSRIISMVLLGTLEFVEGHGPIWIASQARFHHQYLPDRIEFEPGALPPADQAALAALGHTLHPLDRRYGNLQIVVQNRVTGVATAASDPRGEGEAQVLP